MIGWGHNPHKCAKTRARKQFLLITAILVLFSYLTVVLACGDTGDKDLRFSDAENVSFAVVTTEAPASDTDKDLCKFTHEQMIAQSSSNGSIRLSEILYLTVLIGEEMPGPTPIRDAFRPPGHEFASARVLSFQLYSILRI